jgi:hypothetical protein
VICLQGGGEFSPACRAMDLDLVRRAGGRVVVTALAGEVGRDYDTATANGVRHFRAVGAGDVVGAPDAREDARAALEVIASARLLVLPGGSPTRLLRALEETAMAEAIAALPDRRSGGSLAVEPGLGLVGDLLVVPHWSGGSSRGDWLRSIEAAVPSSTTVLGIPEESGILVEGDVLTAVGRSATRLLHEGRELEPGDSWDLL